jgi:hypothetical protein
MSRRRVKPGSGQLSFDIQEWVRTASTSGSPDLHSGPTARNVIGTSVRSNRESPAHEQARRKETGSGNSSSVAISDGPVPYAEISHSVNSKVGNQAKPGIASAVPTANLKPPRAAETAASAFNFLFRLHSGALHKEAGEENPLTAGEYLALASICERGMTLHELEAELKVPYKTCARWMKSLTAGKRALALKSKGRNRIGKGYFSWTATRSGRAMVKRIRTHIAQELSQKAEEGMGFAASRGCQKIQTLVTVPH